MAKKSQKVIIAAGNVIEKDNKILLVQEGKSDYKGVWNLPMGAQKPGEDLVACATREGKEETGLGLKPIYVVGEYKFTLPSDDRVTCYIFKSEITGGEITVPEDMKNVKFFSSEEIKELFVAPFVKNMLDDYKKGKRISIKINKK